MGKKNRFDKIARSQMANANKGQQPKNTPHHPLTVSERIALSFPETKEEENKQAAYVNMKYYAPSFECFSVWTGDELKSFSDFVVKLTKMDWPAIMATGGHVGKKTGLGCTLLKSGVALPEHLGLNGISQDISYIEMRVTGVARVHGFRSRAAFFLVWLDREHRICEA